MGDGTVGVDRLSGVDGGSADRAEPVQVVAGVSEIVRMERGELISMLFGKPETTAGRKERTVFVEAPWTAPQSYDGTRCHYLQNRGRGRWRGGAQEARGQGEVNVDLKG
jgi:hypothetical protein